jgi:mannosylglycerate hydrolase
VIPHAGDWRSAAREARAFEAPMRALETDAHKGVLARNGSMVEAKPQEFEISAVKPSEDGRGVLVRGWNSTDQPLRVVLRPGKIFPRAERVNLAEKRIGSLRIGRKGEAAFTAKPHEIVSVIFRLRKE